MRNFFTAFVTSLDSVAKLSAGCKRPAPLGSSPPTRQAPSSPILWESIGRVLVINCLVHELFLLLSDYCRGCGDLVTGVTSAVKCSPRTGTYYTKRSKLSCGFCAQEGRVPCLAGHWLLAFLYKSLLNNARLGLTAPLDGQASIL